jgi:ADP-heptose:LPS heptosyltransferase
MSPRPFERALAPLPKADVSTGFKLGRASFENHHAPVFYAWLARSPDQRKDDLRDKYLFVSICNMAGPNISDLLAQDRTEADAFVSDLHENVHWLANQHITFGEEWFRGLLLLTGYFNDHNYLDFARGTVELAIETGVTKFPGIAQTIKVHDAYLDAMFGQIDHAAEKALHIVNRPYLLPNRKDLPKLYAKLLYVLASSNKVSEYKTILWRGIASLHATPSIRDQFVDQIGKTYRGTFRAMLHNEVPLNHRLSFFVGNCARSIAQVPIFALFRLDQPIRWLHLALLYIAEHRITKQAFIAPHTPNDSVWKRYLNWQSTPLSGAKFPTNRPKRRILITRAMGGIGDILMMTPGLRALRKTYPNAQIDFAIPKAFHGLLTEFQDVNVIDINGQDIDLKKYTKWVNLTDCPAGKVESRQSPNVKSNRISIFAKAMGIGWFNLRQNGRIPEFQRNHEEIQKAEAILDRLKSGKRGVIGIQPFSADTYKNWPFMEELALNLANDNYSVLIFHSDPIPGYLHQNIHQINRPLRESFALAALCDRLVTPDSSLAHLAGATNTKTISIFGPTSGKVFTRFYPQTRLLTPLKKDFPCFPCWRHEHKPCHLTKGRESICLRSISVERVLTDLRQTEEKWKSPSKPLTKRIKDWILYGNE